LLRAIPLSGFEYKKCCGKPGCDALERQTGFPFQEQSDRLGRQLHESGEFRGGRSVPERTFRAVVGGIAVNAHGHGRTTFDADLVVQLSPGNIHRAFAGLAEIGYLPLVPVTAEDFGDASKRERWKQKKGMFVVQFYSDLHPQMRVDVFIEEPFDFDAEYASAYQAEVAAGLPVRILRLESLIRMKEVAGREKTSEMWDICDGEMRRDDA
jgi:hypothetical protein